jgi:hypothetical protein
VSRDTANTSAADTTNDMNATETTTDTTNDMNAADTTTDTTNDMNAADTTTDADTNAADTTTDVDANAADTTVMLIPPPPPPIPPMPIPLPPPILQIPTKKQFKDVVCDSGAVVTDIPILMDVCSSSVFGKMKMGQQMVRAIKHLVTRQKNAPSPQTRRLFAVFSSNHPQVGPDNQKILIALAR